MAWGAELLIIKGDITENWSFDGYIQVGNVNGADTQFGNVDRNRGRFRRAIRTRCRRDRIRAHRVGAHSVDAQRSEHAERPLGAHRVRPHGGHRSTSDTFTTRHTGRWGVTSGRNQRSQISPRGRPAVDTQFGCPGSASLTTMRHEPSDS